MKERISLRLRLFLAAGKAQVMMDLSPLEVDVKHWSTLGCISVSRSG